MTRFLCACLLLAAPLYAPAQQATERTGPTTIHWIVVNRSGVQVAVIRSAARHNCGGDGQRWLLRRDHPGFDELYSGFLSAKYADRPVELVGNACAGVYKIVDWAYVATP